jgi:hypothetical protein
MKALAIYPDNLPAIDHHHPNSPAHTDNQFMPSVQPSLAMAELGNHTIPLTDKQESTPPPPGFTLVKKSILDGSTTSSETGNGTSGTNAVAGASDAVQANPGRRNGKELVHELGTEVEKKALVVNMARARNASRGRFLAVGIFLSVLAITSKSLIDSMKRVWKIRGYIDTLQLADRRLILEFSEEGDFNHVTKGGPWRFRDDAVLVVALKEGEVSETVEFTTIPIWVQFKKIPLYLLTKQLARDLGKAIGYFICIDNNARGDICEKFVRARVHLPLNKALQRWITLQDKFIDEEVVAFVHYECLPTFCFICGFIGHKDTECHISDGMRSKTNKSDLGVLPIHRDDPRCWFLPETLEQCCKAPPL